MKCVCGEGVLKWRLLRAVSQGQCLKSSHSFGTLQPVVCDVMHSLFCPHWKLSGKGNVGRTSPWGSWSRFLHQEWTGNPTNPPSAQQDAVGSHLPAGISRQWECGSSVALCRQTALLSWGRRGPFDFEFRDPGKAELTQLRTSFSCAHSTSSSSSQLNPGSYSVLFLWSVQLKINQVSRNERWAFRSQVVQCKCCVIAQCGYFMAGAFGI